MERIAGKGRHEAGDPVLYARPRVRALNAENKLLIDLQIVTSVTAEDPAARFGIERGPGRTVEVGYRERPTRVAPAIACVAAAVESGPAEGGCLPRCLHWRIRRHRRTR